MIYLFNQTEELIDVIDEASLADFTHTIELNQFDRASFEIPVDYKPNIIKEAQFFGFQSRDRAFCLFRISEKSYDIGLTIQGIDRAESDLHSFIIEDKRPGGTASDVLREILKGTGYHLGNVDGLTINGNMSFYYISVRQALVKLIESYACEFKIRYTFVENKIIGRYIDLNQRFGRKTGHQFEYGSNILNVTYEESSDEVVTALIGRGKGEQSTNESGEATGGYGRRIQFKDVVWSVSKGDPVDKPAGQNYVANEAARNIYGLHQNGVIKHRFGVYTNEDIEDPVELLKATYKELKRLSVPIVTFKANLLDLANAIEQDIWIGDSVGIVRDQIGIAFEARIHKLIIDKLDDNRSVVELGDYQTLQAKDRSTRQQAIKDAVSGFSEGLIEEAIANEVDRQNKEFDEKIRVNKLEFDNELQRAKERAEEVKRQISDEIDKKFQSFDNAAINEARQKAEEALRNAGASSLLAQEAKQIGLDSVARLEAFKSQTTSAQTALSGDLDALKLTVTSEVNQASEHRRTTTEALSRMTGQMNGFATKSEVKQGIDGLTQTFAKMRVGGRNYYRDSEKIRTSTRFFSFPLHPYLTQENVGETWTLSFDLKINEGGEIRPLHFYHYQNNRFGLKASADITPNKEWQRFTFTGPVIFPNDDPRYARGEMALYDFAGNNSYSVRKIKFEKGTLATDWSPAPEDTDGLITEAKATFERTAQGLRTDLSGIQEYVNKDGQRQEALQRYTREESAKQATAVRELVEKDYVGKATYQETVKAIEHKFEAITNPQNGSIATQIATYKNAVDGRFADITSLISGKANQTDFQRVKETSQFYERILGNTENGIADKVARMAMTNQLFQVEVGKAFAEHQNLFLNSTLTKGFLGNNGIIYVANATQKEVTSDFISVDPNEKIIFQHWVTLPENGMAWTAWQFFDKNKNPIDNRKSGLNAYKTTVGKQHNINQITVPANAYFVRFSARMYDDGLIKVEKGSVPSDYSVAPNDALEAVKTVQRQLAGSWAVQNINSAGDIISGINLGANGHNRFDGKLTHITGETLIDKAVIKSAMIDKLKTANFEAGSVTTVILDAEAVTAEKLKVDQAFFNKLVANEAYLNQLFAKQAFINRVQSVAIDASQVRSGILSGDRIYGGTIRGTNIYGGTLTGHTKIQLGSYGSFDTVNGGLQINVPRDYNAKDGLGVQFIGSYGRGENVPYGLFVYKDSDFTVGNTATDTDEFLMTVEGYIKAKGIGWLKTGLGKVGSVSTGTLAFWKSTVALDFAPNDIYYTYGGQAYGLWAIIKQNFSDKRLKENIVDCNHKALDYIQQFQFKEYDWKKQEDRPQQAHTKIGLIAQEVQAVDPTLVYENGDTLNLDNLRLTNIALKAIQELALENRKLTHRLENLENERRTA
ncbi:MAG: phage tail spike protein [Streptococcus mitis]|nr:phage tail spike protein [Streptococcus mitis]